MPKDPAFPLFKNWKLVNKHIGINEGYTSFPKMPGLYAIYIINGYPINIKDNKLKLFYIGTTGNLSKRFERHEVVRCLRALGFWVVIKIRIVDGRKESHKYGCAMKKRNNLERKLINRLKPPINTQGWSVHA